MGPVTTTSAVLWKWLVWITTRVGAEILLLDHTPAPNRSTLTGYYLFDLYAPEDSPGPYDTNMPVFELQDIRVHWKEKPTQWPYEGLEAAIIPAHKFWQLFHEGNFCAGQRMLLALNGTSMKDLGIDKAPLNGWSKMQPSVKRTGTWILVFTNCGNSNGADISGKISLRYSHGFLPVAEYWTMQVYGLLSMVYAIVAALWFVALHQRNGFKNSIHNWLLVVAATAFLECYFSFFNHKWWNVKGNQNEIVATGTLLFNSLKYVFSLRLLLVVGSCQVRFRGEGETPYRVKFYCVAIAFQVQQGTTKLLLQSRHVRYGLAVDPTFVLCTNAVGCLICLGISGWVSAKYVIKGNRESRVGEDDPFVQLFASTRQVLQQTFGLATCVVIMQLLDIKLDSTPCEFQWIPHDGSPLLVFFIFTVLMMLIWWPDHEVWKLAYTHLKKEGHEGHDGPETCPEVAEKLEVEEEVFTDDPERTSERVQPDIVGASSCHERGGFFLAA